MLIAGIGSHRGFLTLKRRGNKKNVKNDNSVVLASVKKIHL